MQPLKLFRLKSFLKTYSLPILSGFLIGTTYIPFFPWALAFCLVPLWIFWLKNVTSYKRLFIGSWITQFILNLIGFYWVAGTAIEFGGFPPILGYLILLLFACAAHLYYPAAALLWGYCARKVNIPFIWILIPVTFALCESFYPTIFFWHLGYPWLWINLPGVHVAEWIGFYGLNLVTLFTNLMVVLFLTNHKKRSLVFALGLYAAVHFTGVMLKQRFQEGEKTLKVLLVQGNIGNAIKVQQDRGPYFHEYILRKYLEITDRGLRDNPGTQLIVWPETAFPDRVRAGKKPADSYEARLRYSVSSFRTPLLTGAYEENDKRDVFNSMVLYDEKGDFVASYKKTMLLAFGEYFPGATLLPQLKTWFPMVSDFGRGDGPGVLPLTLKGESESGGPSTIALGAQICYEGLFDEYSEKLFEKKSQIIFNVTNDSWFGKYSEPYQHLYMTLARAIEFRVPLVRTTNTGISTVISASGEIGKLSPIHEEWSGGYTVKYKAAVEPTVYSLFAGHWPLILIVVFLGLFAGGVFVKSRNA